MGLYGADVGKLRELSTRMDKAAELLGSRSKNLHAEIMAAPWKGQDASRFIQSWNSDYRPGLERAIAALRENAKVLKNQAKEQEDASNSSGGGSGGAGNGPSPATSQEDQKALTDKLDQMAHATPEQQAAWWNSLTDAEKKYLLSNKDTATAIMGMEGGVPESARDTARDYLLNAARHDVPVYKSTDKAGLEAEVAWFHGGAHVTAEVTKNADGTATMKVSGDLGLGVNTKGDDKVGATLSGEVSRTYQFKSLEDAVAARNKMYDDLPPDSFGKAKDVISNPPGYVLDTIDHAATANHTISHSDSAKGELSLEASGKAGDASGNASLKMAYEQNLTDGTSSGSVQVSATGKLDMDGRVFQANGNAGLTVNMDKGHNISSVSLAMDGTVAQGASEATGVDGNGYSGSVTAGTQGSVKIDIPYTPDNKVIIDSYLHNVAVGNDQAANADAARLYHAGSATYQTNSVVTAKGDYGFDIKAASVKVTTESSTSTNVSTYQKAPNDGKLVQMKQ
ncbi:WXG100 family type VII secretion target [Arthrobacter sp. NPDC090010]|uniref:WXG100 family type VII secretion target n=1 Tax=Arthrobacter sp. NPDC090010 TaxID=3363942 RepID=UPI00380D287F